MRSTESRLPLPDADSAEHSRKVAASVRRLIEASGGSISFGEFMQHVLYAPGLGYYSAGSRKFGEHGDFVTAPEVSPLFARVVARQCAEILGQFEAADILELGAGSGVLAADLLEALAGRDSLPGRYYILETSADLRERQHQLLEDRLSEHAARVHWLDALPNGFTGVVIANEVADALPVERFTKEADGVLELRVVSSGDGFAGVQEPAPQRLLDAVRRIEADLGGGLPDGYRSEVSLGLSGWIGDLAASVREGMLLLFDYGVSRREYYAADRNGGWLRCHFRHHAHDDPFVYPGIQDLTAWVDFTAVADAASRSGLSVSGYVSQAAFLLHGGLQEEVASMAAKSVTEQLEISGQLRKLTLPGEMGEYFKCMALSRGNLSPPAALAAADHAHRL